MVRYVITLLLNNSKACLQKENYQTLSLIPLSTEVTNITTQGLAYPLNGEALRLGVVRGVSNCFNEDKANIMIESGVRLLRR